MSKQFWIFLIAGIGVVGVMLAVLLVGTKSAHLELTGSILKVRTVALGPAATLAVADFRITNPSQVPFVVRDVALELEPESGERQSARIVSKPQVETVFAGLKLIGTKFNDVLGLQDKVPPGQTLDRMAAGRFEVPEARLDARKTLRLRIEDVDGAVFEIVEKR